MKDRRKLTDVSRTYLEWFETEGEPAFEFVSSHLMAGELNEKVIAFYRYYSFMLAEVFGAAQFGITVGSIVSDSINNERGI